MTAFWSRMPTRDSWRWSSSALTKEVAPWPSPIGRNGRTLMRFVSRSTICACSPPIPPHGSRDHRAVYAAGAPPRKPADSSGAKGGNVSEHPASRFTRKGLATRARIIDVAARLMFERGVANTSIEQVRSAAGVGGSQITHYFHDKRDLTRQVVATRRNDIQTFHTQPRLSALDSLDALRAWSDACVSDIAAVYRVGGCVYGSLAGELIEADDEVHADLSAGYDDWIGLVQGGVTGT